MSAENIGPKIVLEGEKEYRSAISGINRDQKVLTSEMKAMSAEFDGNANSVQALTKKSEILNKEYDAQEKKVRTLRGALDSVKSTYGENSNQVKEWQVKLNNANAELSGLNKEIKANDKYLDEAKASASGTAKSIDEFGKEVKTAGDSTLKTGDIIKANLISGAVIGGIQALGSAMGNAATKTVDLVKGAATYADDMLTMSTQTGVSTDKLQAYNYMAELTDTSMEDMTKSMAKNIKSMSNAQSGSEKYVDAYKKLNVAYEDGNGKLRDSEDVYWNVIDALKGITDQTERDSISMQLFGKSAQDLNPLIVKGSEGVKALTEEAKSMGAVLSTDTLNSLGETDDALQRMYQSTDIAKRKFGAEMAPVVAEAAKKITDEITNMDGELADMAGGALGAVTDGLIWVIDNSDLVISGLSGIGAAMVTQAAVTGITSAVSALKSLTVALKGTAEAQKALNLAESANPIGITLTAVIGLTTALAIYNRTHQKTNEQFEKLKTQIDTTSDSCDKLVSQVESTKEAFSQNSTEINTTYEATQKLSNQLYDLADKENKTNAEKAKMQSLVDQLNASIPNLNLVMNKQTGALSEQKVQVDSLITSLREKALAEAYEERYLELTKEQISLQSSLKSATDSQKAAEDALTDAKEKGRSSSINSQADIKKSRAAIKDCEDQLDKAKTSVSNVSDSLKDNSKQLSDTESHLGKTSTATEDYAATADSSSKKVDSSLAKLEKSYKDAKKSAEDSIQSQIDIFSKFSTKTDLTKDKLLKNLKSQVDGIKDWSENLQSLSDRGINKGLLEDLKNMGPSAAAQISLLNSMSDKELKEYSKAWSKLGKETKKAADVATSGLKDAYIEAYKQQEKDAKAAGGNTIKNYNKGIVDNYDSVKNVLSNTTRKAIEKAGSDNKSSANSTGASIADGIASGVNSKKGALGFTMENIAVDMISSIKKKFDIHSPSKVMEKEVGEQIAEGVIKGIDGKKEYAKKSASELGQIILEAAKKKLENYEVYHDLSVKQEMNYWNRIRKELKKGTQARIDADKEYLDRKKEIDNAIVDAAKNELENKKVYNNLSLQEEVDYWNKIRKEVKKGTQARIDADKEYLDAKNKLKDAEKEILQTEADDFKEYNDNYKKINQDKVDNIAEVQKNEAEKEADIVKRRLEAETTYADGCKEINANLKRDIQSLSDAYDNAVETRTKSISNAMGLFSEFKVNDVTGDTLITNLRGQDAALASWSQNLSILKNRGVDNDFIKELQDLGVGSAGEVKAIVNMTDSQLTEYVNLWKNKNTLAKTEAVTELESLKAETSTKIAELNAQAKEDLETVKTTYNKALSDLDKELEITRSDAAAKIEAIRITAMAEIKAATQAYLDTLKELIPQSKEIGGSVADGLISGIISRLTVLNSGAQLVGSSITQGVIAGIGSKSSSLNIAATSMVSGVISGARLAAGIHSPSTKMAELVGTPLAQGVESGFVKTMSNVQNEMAKAIPTDFNTDVKTSVTYSQASSSVSASQNIGLLTNIVKSVIGDMKLSATIEAPMIIGTQEFGRAVVKCQLAHDDRYNATPQLA